MKSDKPLVTFAVIAYNQQDCIRGAIAGALAQTYTPLQIILSDDCSSDHTFSIMEEEASNYKGPHTIVINRNPTNLGIGAHLNRVMELAEGELIVQADGDDVSLRHRTQAIVDAWLASGRRRMAIYSAAVMVDAAGHNLGFIKENRQQFFHHAENLVAQNFFLLGATLAWAKQLHDFFGPLRPDVTHEDNTIPLRAALLGEIYYINEPLITYRYGVGLSANFNEMNVYDALFRVGATVQQRHYISCLQRLADIEHFGQRPELIPLAQKRIAEQELIVNLSKRARIKITDIQRMAKTGVSLAWIFKQILVYKLPVFYQLYNRCKAFKKDRGPLCHD